jgi:hypothetical protein
VFKRVSLTGSAELFKETTGITDPILEEKPEPVAPLRPAASLRPVTPEPPPEPAQVHHLPRRPDATPYYQVSLTESQLQTLIDSVQRIKYPHASRSTAKPSMEEFERLEALRQVLLDSLR